MYVIIFSTFLTHLHHFFIPVIFPSFTKQKLEVKICTYINIGFFINLFLNPFNYMFYIMYICIVQYYLLINKMSKLKYAQPFTILLLKNYNLMMYIMFCSHQTMFLSMHVSCILTSTFWGTAVTCSSLVLFIEACCKTWSGVWSLFWSGVWSRF
jgi:hypothetical protein